MPTQQAKEESVPSPTDEDRKLAREIAVEWDVHCDAADDPCITVLEEMIALALVKHRQRIERETLEKVAKHRPVLVNGSAESFASNWVECSCGEAKANGTVPYEQIWRDHIRALGSGDGHS